MKEKDMMQEQIYETVDMHLRVIGVPSDNVGYNYLKEAIVIAVEQIEKMDCSLSNLFEKASKIFNCSVAQINSCIKDVIDIAFKNLDNEEVKQYYFGNSISNLKKRPTKLEFIAAVREKIVNKTDMFKQISEHLLEIGTPMHLKGYSYLKYAISLILEDFSITGNYGSKMYSQVAKTFGTTNAYIAKSMSDIIENTLAYRGNPKVLKKYFGNSLNLSIGKPTNIEFMTAIREQMVEEDVYMKLASEHLRAIGIPMNYDGFEYLKKSIVLIINGEEILNTEERTLLRTVAKSFNVRTIVVERGMAIAVDCAFKIRETLTLDEDYFKDYSTSKPTVFKIIKYIKKRILNNVEI